ncbi:protein transport protein bet1 [Balamuthia mandrillaris]
MSLRTRTPFGSSFGSSGRGSLLGYDAPPQRNDEPDAFSFQQLMVEQNDNSMAQMTEKVSAIKHITLEIQNEIRQGSLLLDELEGSFSSASGLLKATRKRLDRLAHQATSRHVFYLVLFFFFILFFLYYILK